MFMHTIKTTFLTWVWMQGFLVAVCRIEIWGVWRLGQCLELFAGEMFLLSGRYINISWTKTTLLRDLPPPPPRPLGFKSLARSMIGTKEAIG